MNWKVVGVSWGNLNQDMEKFTKRKEMYFSERIYRIISIPAVKLLAKTIITPNMVSFFNYILAIFNVYLMINKKFSLISAALIIIYSYLDAIDGNLARFTNKTSELGRILDNICDYVFYNMFLLFIGYGNISIFLLIIVLLIYNFYAIITTKYIVPEIKKIKNFKRGKIKGYLIKKGIILGPDVSLLGILLCISILSGKFTIIYILIMCLYIIDTIYRLTELQVNKYNNDINLEC